MKNYNDYSFIASKFDEEGITCSDDLTLDKILSEGSEKNKTVKFKKKRRGAKALISLVACIAVIAVSVTEVNAYYDAKYEKAENIISFSGYHQINALLSRLSGGLFSSFRNINDSMDIFGFATDVMKETAYDASAVKDMAGYSKTNKQVESVDEADIVKTDGKYIYYLNKYEITIYIADGKNSTQIGKINNFYALFDEMYIVGDRLIAISGNDVKADEHTLFSSTVSIYDISDRSNPKLENKFSQSGSYTSSRMVGEYLYLVSSYYAENKEIPYITYGEDNPLKLSYKDIYCMPCVDTAGFVVVSAINIADAESKTKTKAIIGGNENIYCSENNLYLLNEKHDYSYKNGESSVYTNIVRIRLNGLKLDFDGKATVRGYAESQYSLDEKDGYLRIATSDYNANNLYILNDKMKQTGAVEGYAQAETIQAVRYIDDYAYVITYEQTDPLFIIDLSNPEKPEITGSVKITGFSDNLFPVNDNTLLGVGYADNSQYIKLAVFDISNKNEPKVTDSRVYYSTSEAQNDIKALLINKESGYFAFVYDMDDSSSETQEYSYSSGIITFEVQGGKLVETNNFKSGSSIFLGRCVYIGDEIYALTIEDEMLVYDMGK